MGYMGYMGYVGEGGVGTKLSEYAAWPLASLFCQIGKPASSGVAGTLVSHQVEVARRAACGTRHARFRNK